MTLAYVSSFNRLETNFRWPSKEMIGLFGKCQSMPVEWVMFFVAFSHVLAERTFRTKEFYRQFEDQLTPAGLAFYQTDWDASLTDFFHKTLDMKEPIYEFDFPVPYKKPAVWFPKKQPFNLYMDKHRDPKQIAKELLVQRFKSTDPFQPPAKPLRFPNAMPEDNSLPSWYRVELRKRRLRWGRYSDMWAVIRSSS